MKNWLRNKLHNFLYPREDEYNKIEVACADESDNEVDLDHGFKFTVMPAQGGIIVQLRSYDYKKDRRSYSTHVIPDEAEVAGAIGHIVSMELLRGTHEH